MAVLREGCAQVRALTCHTCHPLLHSCVWCGTERVHVRGCARAVLRRALVYSRV